MPLAHSRRGHVKATIDGVLFPALSLAETLTSTVTPLLHAILHAIIHLRVPPHRHCRRHDTHKGSLEMVVSAMRQGIELSSPPGGGGGGGGQESS